MSNFVLLELVDNGLTGRVVGVARLLVSRDLLSIIGDLLLRLFALHLNVFLGHVIAWHHLR